MFLYIWEANMKDLKSKKQTIIKQLLSAIILCGFLSFALPAADLVPFTKITPSQATAMITEKESDPLFIILDVRTAKEFEDTHIKGAQNIDLKAPDFKEKIDKLDRNGIYLAYCRKGKGSAKAMNLLKKAGFKQVYSLAGGIMKWEEEGLPLEVAPLQVPAAKR